MNKIGAFLPLAFLVLLVACGVSNDSSNDPGLRPTPPALRPEAPRPQPAALSITQNQARVSPWYERYDLNEVVVRIRPGALASSAQEQGITRDITTRAAARVSPRPARITSEAFVQRLEVLRRERDQLLHENTTLTAGLERQQAREVQTWQPKQTGLSTLKAQLSRLIAQQRLVTTQAQAVTAEHQALITLLSKASAN